MPYLLFLFNRQHWRHYSFLLQQIDIRRTLIRAGLYLISVFTLHSLVMVEVEGLSVDEAVWLTLTTVVTVGYGDFAAKTVIGRIATVLLLYVGSIFVLFHVAADYFQYRSERKLAMLRGRWKWKMKNHVLILNSPSINRDRYVLGLVEELHRTERWSDSPVLMVTRDYENGLPEEFQTAGVVHYHGDASIPEDLEAAAVADAAVILVLAENAGDKRSDETTFNILHRLREQNVKGRIIAECVRRANRTRLRSAGAHCIMRPIRFYPEIVVRAIDSPGTEQILENLFMSEGDACRSFAVSIDGVPWSDLVSALMNSRLGMAVAYQDRTSDPDHNVHCNPDPDQPVHSDCLYVIVKPEREVTRDDIKRVVSNLRSNADVAD